MKKERQGKNVLFILWPEISTSRYVLTRHVTSPVLWLLCTPLRKAFLTLIFQNKLLHFLQHSLTEILIFFLNRAPENHVFERVEPANLLRNTHC